jgi:hypothetical protein
MADAQWFPLTGCLQQATERQTAYVNSEIHLFKAGLTPTPSTTLADLVAVEADYDTYAPETLAAWLGPILAPGSGYEILSPLVVFEVGASDPVLPNNIGGWWLQDAGGRVRIIGTFNPSLPMQLAGQGIPLSVLDIFPTGFTG